MASLVYEGLGFDYVFLEVGYTSRLMKTPIQKNNNILTGTLAEYIETGLSKSIDNDINVLAVCDKSWSSSEIYADKQTIKFLKETKIDPARCIIVGNNEYHISMGDIHQIVSLLKDLHFCAMLDPCNPYDMKVYEYDGKTIVKIIYDTESG